MSERLPVVVAITGASGAPYAIAVLRGLVAAAVPTWLIISDHGYRLLDTECGAGSLALLRERVGSTGFERHVRVFDDRDRGALPASGSVRTGGMVICPCSMGTIAAVAHGTSRSLVERAADVTLKERRKLVVVPRETPYSAVHLRNMLCLTTMGVVVLPASPGFYHRPSTIDDLVGFVAGRILDHLDVDHALVPRWSGEGGAGTTGDGARG